MTQPYTPMSALPIRLPEDLRMRLAQLSAQDHVAQQVHIRLALAEYLDKKLPPVAPKPRRRPGRAAPTAPPVAEIALPTNSNKAKKAGKTPPKAPQSSAAATDPQSTSPPLSPPNARVRRQRQTSPTFR